MRIVSLADVALVVYIYAFFIDPLLIFRHRLNGLLINHVIELIHVKIIFGIEEKVLQLQIPVCNTLCMAEN